MRSCWNVTHSWKLALAVVCATLIASGAQAAEALRWKLKSGEQLNYIMDRQIDGKLNLSGAEIEFKAQMIFDTTWKVKSVAADGSANIEQTLDRMQINMSSPLGGNLEYDSANPSKPDSPAWNQVEPMVSMLGETFKWKINPQGTVTDVELPQKLQEIFEKQKSGGNRQQGFGIGNNMFSERGIKEFIEKSVLPLPKEAPGGDESWTQSFENVIPHLGTQTTEITYSFSGQGSEDGKNVAKIASKTELTFEPADDAQADLEITSQKGSGAFLFDPAAGRLLKSKSTQQSAMELSGPRDLTQEIEEVAEMRMGKSPEPKK